MNKIIIFRRFLIFVLMINPAHIFCQYVTLEGRQFKIGAQDFYPVVCNYSFMLTYNPDNPVISDYYLSRINGYGEGYLSQGSDPLPNYDFECYDQASAYNEIIADLTKIRSMGFNTIRAVGFVAAKEDSLGEGKWEFVDTAYQNVHPIWQQNKSGISYTRPYSNDQYVQNLLLPKLDLILQAAEECSLKVILLTGGGDLDHHDINAQDYADLLSVISDHLKNNAALMAYDLYNEPYWPWENLPTKQKVCEYTTLWYNSIKAADNNHLVTLGGHHVWHYDPEVMKLDFLSPHIYPFVKTYEQYSQVNALDRTKGEIYWVHDNSPMPWMIGEIGHNAIDDYLNYGQGISTPTTLYPPITHGDLNQQADYAENTLAITRDCDGSGYSWWNYQENWWGPGQDGYGMLRHGALNWPNIDKPVVDVFENYPNPPPQPGECNKPLNYYDPNNFSVYSPEFANLLQGVVYEEGTNKTIADAYLQMRLDVYFQNDPNPYDFSNYSYTYTNGGYTINKKYPGSDNSIITGMGFAASGGETHWDVVLPNDPQPTSMYNCTLKYRPFKYDGWFEDVIIPANTTRNLKGWNTLLISNVTIESNAVSEIKARNGVTLSGGEFTAELTSEVYIYCTETFPDCDDFDFNRGFKSAHTGTNEPPGLNSEREKQIVVDFIPRNYFAFLDVYPNPGNGNFTLNLRTNKEDNPVMQVNVYDITGSCVFKAKLNGYISALDLSSLSKGIYYLHVNSANDTFKQKLIIN